MYKFINIKSFKSKTGLLSVIEDNDFDFKLKRIFTIVESKNVVRGNHAHKKCIQIFQCLHGSVKIELNNGLISKKILLKNPNKCLIVFNRVWASQHYLEKLNILNVFCNMKYNKNDYINDFKQLIKK